MRIKRRKSSQVTLHEIRKEIKTGFFNKMELFNLEKPKENFLQQEKYGLRYNISFSGYIFSSFWNGKNK